MKKKLLISIMLTTASFAYTIHTAQGVDVAQAKKDAAMCKLFTDKAVNYKQNMREDGYAKRTLESYKTRVHHYCGH